jgi:hypothetical protein
MRSRTTFITPCLSQIHRLVPQTLDLNSWVSGFKLIQPEILEPETAYLLNPARFNNDDNASSTCGSFTLRIPARATSITSHPAPN